MIYISDPHGCYYTLRRLLKKLPDDMIALGGDLVDRGPHSAELLMWAKDNQVPTVLGNHEQMMLEAIRGWHGDSKIPYNYQWEWNGGDTTIASLNKLPTEKILELTQWVRNLPTMYIFGEVLLSHTGHGLKANKSIALWDRSMLFPNDGYYRVFGHTPQSFPQITDTYACIDTGAVFTSPNFGKLTAFQYPSMRVWSQERDETPLT